MKSIYIAWQDHIDRSWHPVAKLAYDEKKNVYRFSYTRGAKNNKRFVTFPRLDDVDAVYESTSLFSFLKNRLVGENRVEHGYLMSWLDLNLNDYTFEMLSLTGAERATDNIRVIPSPKMNKKGEFYVEFLANGVRHLREDEKINIKNLRAEDEVGYFYEDSEYDKNAIALVQKSTGLRVGYCPRYLTHDIKTLIEDEKAESADFYIKKVNYDAPFQYKVLCGFRSKWPDGFVPFLSEEYLASNPKVV